MAAAALCVAAAAPALAPAAPRIDQMVVLPTGKAKLDSVRSGRTRVRSSSGRCRVPARTPLAALVRSRVARVRVRDFSRTCDPSSLFVRAIGRHRNRGQRGWVYKVGNRQGTTAASDPSGPFGSGRIRRRTRVTWFYCVFGDGGCQRTLALRARHEGGGVVTVRVRAHDDEGRGTPAEGARVRAGRVSAETDASGTATLTLPEGRHRVVAKKDGHIRSFAERVRVP